MIALSFRSVVFRGAYAFVHMSDRSLIVLILALFLSLIGIGVGGVLWLAVHQPIGPNAPAMLLSCSAYAP